MFVWVAYDISDNNLRTRIADHCKDLGLVRFQKSIFLGESDRATLQMLASLIRREMEEDASGEEDGVAIGTLCGSCQKVSSPSENRSMGASIGEGRLSSSGRPGGMSPIVDRGRAMEREGAPLRP